MDKELYGKTDEKIAEIVQKGNVSAYAVLLQRYESKMRRYAKKFLFGIEDAEDLAQDVFIKAYQNINSFDIKRKFSPWLYRIAHNEFINALKKRGRRPFIIFDTDTLFPHPASKDNPSSEIEKAEIKQEIDTCLNQLDYKYREPIILYYYEELTYEEISDIMKIPVTTVGVRIKRAKDKLKSICANLE